LSQQDWAFVAKVFRKCVHVLIIQPPDQGTKVAPTRASKETEKTHKTSKGEGVCWCESYRQSLRISETCPAVLLTSQLYCVHAPPHTHTSASPSTSYRPTTSAHRETPLHTSDQNYCITSIPYSPRAHPDDRAGFAMVQDLVIFVGLHTRRLPAEMLWTQNLMSGRESKMWPHTARCVLLLLYI
jgi:hypothetical protein